MGDRRLAHTPAETDLLAPPLGRKVDETRVRVLHDRARLVDPVDTARDAAELAADALVEVGDGVRVDAAAVACDREVDPAAPLLELAQVASVLDQALRERTNRVEQRVRLLDREVPLRHQAMIEAT